MMRSLFLYNENRRGTADAVPLLSNYIAFYRVFL